MHGGVRHDEAAIATDVEAGQDVLAGGNGCAGVLEKQVDATAWREGTDGRWQRSIFALEAGQQFLAGLTVEVENEDPADPAGDNADAVATDGEPVVDLCHRGACLLEAGPGDGGDLLAGAHRHHGPAEPGIEAGPGKGAVRWRYGAARGATGW